jgi:hypothetical protein
VHKGLLRELFQFNKKVTNSTTMYTDLHCTMRWG